MGVEGSSLRSLANAKLRQQYSKPLCSKNVCTLPMKNESPIVRVFFAKMKPDFFQLSEQERRQFMARDRANLDALGMKAIAMIDCSESDDEWDYIGVESWPSMKAVEKRERFENEILHISKYVEYKIHMGVGQSFEEYGKPQ